MQSGTMLPKLSETTQTISFSQGDGVYSSEVFANDVVVTTNAGSHNHGSSKMKLKNLVDYNWEPKFYSGHLLALHMSGKYLAYSIKSTNNINPGTWNGMVRVVYNPEPGTDIRSLIRGIRGEVHDLAFAHIANQVLLSCIDEHGNIYVYDIIAVDGVVRHTLLGEVREDTGLAGSVHRVVWCPYVPDVEEDTHDEDVARLLLTTHGNTGRVWNIRFVEELARRGDVAGAVSAEAALAAGAFHTAAEHAAPIVDGAFSPDGTALATASADGYVLFYKVYDRCETASHCLHKWQPHDGAPLSCLFFLDNFDTSTNDVQFWKYAVTGAENNSILKIWSCKTWSCHQTITFAPSIGVDSSLVLKATLDKSAKYLVVSEQTSRCLYVLQLKTTDSEAYCAGISEFLLPFPVLCFILRAEEQPPKCESSCSDPFHRNGSSGDIGVSPIDYDLHRDDSSPDLDGSCCPGAVRLRLYIVQPKGLQEAMLTYMSPVSQLNITNMDSTENLGIDDMRLGESSETTMALSSILQQQSQQLKNLLMRGQFYFCAMEAQKTEQTPSLEESTTLDDTPKRDETTTTEDTLTSKETPVIEETSNTEYTSNKEDPSKIENGTKTEATPIAEESTQSETKVSLKTEEYTKTEVTLNEAALTQTESKSTPKTEGSTNTEEYTKTEVTSKEAGSTQTETKATPKTEGSTKTEVTLNEAGSTQTESKSTLKTEGSTNTEEYTKTEVTSKEAGSTQTETKATPKTEGSTKTEVTLNEAGSTQTESKSTLKTEGSTNTEEYTKTEVTSKEAGSTQTETKATPKTEGSTKTEVTLNEAGSTQTESKSTLKTEGSTNTEEYTKTEVTSKDAGSTQTETKATPKTEGSTKTEVTLNEAGSTQTESKSTLKTEGSTNTEEYTKTEVTSKEAGSTQTETKATPKTEGSTKTEVTLNEAGSTQTESKSTLKTEGSTNTEEYTKTEVTSKEAGSTQTETKATPKTEGSTKTEVTLNEAGSTQTESKSTLKTEGSTNTEECTKTEVTSKEAGSTQTETKSTPKTEESTNTEECTKTEVTSKEAGSTQTETKSTPKTEESTNTEECTKTEVTSMEAGSTQTETKSTPKTEGSTNTEECTKTKVTLKEAGSTQTETKSTPKTEGSTNTEECTKTEVTSKEAGSTQTETKSTPKTEESTNTEECTKIEVTLKEAGSTQTETKSTPKTEGSTNTEEYTKTEVTSKTDNMETGDTPKAKESSENGGNDETQPGSLIGQRAESPNLQPALNLMTPDAFSSPGKRDEDDPPLSSTPDVQSTQRTSLAASNNGYQEELEQQPSIADVQKFSAGSSPSREVQEIMSLSDEFYKDNQDEALVVEDHTDAVEQNGETETTWPQISIAHINEANQRKASTDNYTTQSVGQSVHVSNNSEVIMAEVQDTVTQAKPAGLCVEDRAKIEALEHKIDKLTDLLSQQSRELRTLRSELSDPREMIEQAVQAHNVRTTTAIQNALSEGWERVLLLSESSSRAAAQAAGRGAAAALEPLAASLRSELASKLSATDQLLRDNLDKLVTSKTVMEKLSASVSSTLSELVRGWFRDSLAATVLPAIEKSHAQMFRQLNIAFQQGTKEFASNTETLARTAAERGASSVIAPLHVALERHTEALSAASSNNTQQQLVTLIGDTTKAVLEKELSWWRTEARSVVTEMSRAHSPAPSVSQTSAKERQMQVIQVQQMINGGDINGAFQLALSASDLALVMCACRAAEPARVFGPPCALKQHVLLSLVQQLAADMTHDTQLKHRYLEEAILNMDTNNPVTREHLPVVVRELKKQVASFVSAHPAHALLRPLRMLNMAAESLLAAL